MMNSQRSFTHLRRFLATNKLVVLSDKATLEQFENNELTYDFSIPDENDTIGNIIQSYVFDNYVIKKKKILEDSVC
jgi:hypothetical protein